MIRSRKRKLLLSARNWASLPLASAALTCSGVAYAQQTSSGGLEEIIVTAQKRAEDLQKVPISLQVLGTEKLEQLQVKGFDDYAKFLPSLSFDSLGPGQANIYFRGISAAGSRLHAGRLPTTGVYLDETPVTTVDGSLDVHIYDIARVEALAGPQGTLYGASSLAGTLRIITNKPDPKRFSGSFDVKGEKFGKGDAGGGFEGYVNVPLSEHSAVRLVGYYDHEGGYISNVPGTVQYQRGCSSLFPTVLTEVDPLDPRAKCAKPNPNPPPAYVVLPDAPTNVFNNASLVKDRFNTVDTYGGRAALKVDLNNGWSISPSVLYQHQKADGAFSFDPKVGDLKVADFRPDFNLDHWYQAALIVEGKIGNFDALYSGGYFERRTDNEVDYTNYTISYDKFASGYTRFYDAAGNVQAPSVDPTQYTANHDRYTKVNHEIRFSSPTDRRLRWVGGAFLQRQTDNIRAEFRVDGLPLAYQVDGQGEIIYLSQQDRIDRDSAVFTDLTYDLTDKLKVSGGIRKFWVDNTLYGFFGFNSGNSGEGSCAQDSSGNPILLPPGSNRPCINTNKRVTESGETHKVTLTYQFDSDHMLYTTYSTGYRPGGNNRIPGVIPYKADQLTNYELGWKSSWADRRVRFNGAVFSEKWEGVQLGIQGQQGITSLFNVGDAKVNGIEADLSWLALDQLTLTLSATAVDAKTSTRYCPQPNGVVTSDCALTKAKADANTRLPVTPRVKANASARYKFNVGRYDSFIQGAISHQGDSTFSLEADRNVDVGIAKSFTTFDLSAGVSLNNWNVEAYIQNAFDTRGEWGRISQCSNPYCDQHFRSYPIQPMLFGIRYGRKY